MTIFHYSWGKPYDDDLIELVKTAKHFINGGDDFRLLVVGDTGTGKSHLLLWIYEMFAGDKADIRHFGLNESSYSKAVLLSRDARRQGEQYVFCCYDEANVYSTETMAPFNRAIMKLMGEIRGLKIFHGWAMPNPGRLQSDFIDETFNAMIYIYTKDKDRPRLYSYFDRRSIDRMRQKEGSPSTKARITLDFLRRVHKKYRTYMGCFKEYNGVLRKAYDELKTDKMDERVDWFFSEFGDERGTQQDIAKASGSAPSTVTEWVKEALSNGELIAGDDVIMKESGRRSFSKVGMIKVRNVGLRKHNLPLIPLPVEESNKREGLVLNYTRKEKKNVLEQK